jgi:hypothetical protein
MVRRAKDDQVRAAVRGYGLDAFGHWRSEDGPQLDAPVVEGVGGGKLGRVQRRAEHPLRVTVRRLGRSGVRQYACDVEPGVE